MKNTHKMPFYIILRNPPNKYMTYISMTVSVIIPRAIFVNMNKIQQRQDQEDFRRIFNDGQKLKQLDNPSTIRSMVPSDFAHGYVHFIWRISGSQCLKK